MTGPPHTTLKTREWQRRLLHWVSALLLFETLPGLSVYLLPFSVPNQVMVLAHPLAGLGFTVPFAGTRRATGGSTARLPCRT
jgi:hypothetical protein